MRQDEIEVQGLSTSPNPRLGRGTGLVESDLNGKQRLQQALFPPRGMAFDNSHCNPVTSSIFYAIEDFGANGRGWLPPRDSNPDMLIQSQLSCR